MKGLKSFFQKYRVFVILMLIVLVCVITMGICLINYFYGSKESNPYGDRLEGIEDVEITSSRKSELEAKLEADEFISKDTSITVTGKIIYITIVFNDGITLVEAQGKAISILEEFSDEEKNFYDFHFTLKHESSESSEGFIISGAKNVHGTNVVWNNNIEVEEEKTTE